MFQSLVKYFPLILFKKYDLFLGHTLTRFSTIVVKGNKQSAFHKYKPIMDAPSFVFKGVLDRFNGVTINSTEENDDKNFTEKLEKSLKYWLDNNRRAVWFKVDINHSDWVPQLAKKGFNFHHAKDGFVMMYKWLSAAENSNIPEYAHTMIGVGGLVVNDKDEVLVVSDRFALIPDSWKLPGGYVEPKEDLVNAAIREVKEETGVETTFDSIISFRHSHGGNFNCSDIYVVIALTPLTTQLTRCEQEIAKVDWMPIKEFLNNSNVHETNRHFIRTYMEYKERGIKIDCEERIHQILKKRYNLYLVKF